MATTIQDPAAQNPDAGVTDVSRSPKERVGGIISALTGGQSGKLDDVIAAHHQKRLDAARRARQEWSDYHSVLTTGKNPDTGDPLTDDEKAKYQNWADGAWADYEKAAGVNPQAKKSLQQSKGLIDRVTGLFKQHQQQQVPGSLPAPPAATATPAASAAPAADATATEGENAGLPPPPSATAGPSAESQAAIPPRTAQVAADAPRLAAVMSAQRADKRELDMYTAKQKALYEQKMDLEEAKAKARAANPTVSRYSPKILGDELPPDAVDVRNQPITPDKAPHGTVWTTFDGGQHFLQVSDDYVFKTVGNIMGLYSKRTGEFIRPVGEGPVNLGSTTKTTDPATGQTTTSVRTPKTAASAGSLPTPPSSAPSAKPSATAAPTGGGTTPRKAPAAASAKASDVTLDKDGLIPADTKGYSPQVIEGANQLIQDRDVDKIPAKTRELSAALARQAGWFQGKWTPQDESRISQTKTFLEKLRDSDTLKVLDSSAWNRFWVSRANKPESKSAGILADIGEFTTAKAAKGLTEDEAKFNALNNQLVSVAAGVSTLTRAGRATNAMIDSIRREMPNVLSTKDSKDAKRRINNLLQEIDNAHKIGVGGAAQRRGGGLEKPPSAKAAAPVLTDAAKAYIRENHPNVAVP
jgi:hypothetical protein